MTFLYKKNNFKSKLNNVFVTHGFLVISLFTTISITILNIYLFPTGNISSELEELEIYLESIITLSLFFILYIFGKIPVYSMYGIYLRVGIFILITDSNLVFTEKLSPINIPLISHIEVLLRLSGLVIVFFSGYKEMKKLEIMYSTADIKSNHDELTSLPNRRFFLEAIKSSENEISGIILIDIDFFKRINDIYGHSHGDEMLVKFGILLKSHESDKFIPARIGGEEFAIIVKESSRNAIEKLAKKIIIDTKKISIDKELKLSVSIGIGMLEKKEPIEIAMKKIDQALYSAKKNGRGRIEWSQ